MLQILHNPETIFDLINTYESPLYIYDESIVRMRCKQMHDLLPDVNLRVTYSAKANCNLELLKIIRNQDLDADAMSPGEIELLLHAGYSPHSIFYISNNVSADELLFAINKGILVSVDSLSQLELFGSINNGGKVAIRINPGVGAGHHEKVITAGKNTKFGIQKECITHVKQILSKYNLTLVGINQHIGSLFLDSQPYITSAQSLLEFAKHFNDLQFIDFGGGFGVPYKESEKRLDLDSLSKNLQKIIFDFLKTYDNKDVTFKIEPGRFIVAECGVLLGSVHSTKENYGVKYVGTDIGFNILARPILYDSYHMISVIQKNHSSKQTEEVTVVGNICESGDIIAKNRMLPRIIEGDILAVMNAGAYGFAMSSNYNLRLRPAEVLICENGEHRLIRRRDTLKDLLRAFPGINL